jgi:hypothetical protein
MTISPSRTNDASPKAERDIIAHECRPLARILKAQAVSQTGEFSTGTSGDYSAGIHMRLRSALNRRSGTQLFETMLACFLRIAPANHLFGPLTARTMPHCWSSLDTLGGLQLLTISCMPSLNRNRFSQRSSRSPAQQSVQSIETI